MSEWQCWALFKVKTFFLPLCADRGWLELNSRCEPLIHFQPAGRKPGDAPQFSHVCADLGTPPTRCGRRAALPGRHRGSECPFRGGLVQSRACLTLLMHCGDPPDGGRSCDSAEESEVRMCTYISICVQCLLYESQSAYFHYFQRAN